MRAFVATCLVRVADRLVTLAEALYPTPRVNEAVRMSTPSFEQWDRMNHGERNAYIAGLSARRGRA